MTNTPVILCGPPVSALGGGPTHIKNLLGSPLKDRYRFIHFETGSRGTESPAKDEKLLAMIFRLLASPWALAWRILRSRPALVHINSAMDNRAFWRDAVYLLVCKLFRCRVVFQVHGGLLAALCPNGPSKRLVRWLFGLADAVVVLASVERRDFERLGIEERVVVIPNGVDMRDYQGTASRAHSGRIRRLAYLGRLLREKGVFEAVQAVDTLRTEDRFADIELRIAGTGPVLDELRSYIKTRGLEKHVRLVGAVAGADKVRFLRDADVFVFASYHPEGLPYSILESLAAGTPVIASRAGGIPDVVIDGVHGLLVEARDPRPIVDAIHALSASEDRLRQMSVDCLQWASRKLGLGRLADQFGQLYEDVTSGKPRPRIPSEIVSDATDADRHAIRR